MDWYYVRDGEQVGPIGESEFQSLVSSGVITQNTVVWREGMAGWQSYGAFSGRSSGIAPTPMGPVATGGLDKGFKPLVCAECGNMFPADEMVAYGEARVCAACKPVFFQRIKEGAALRGVFDYGGFWIRFVAKMVDSIILAVVNTSIQFGLGGLVALSSSEGPAMGLIVLTMLAQYTVAATYTTWFLGKYAATPGKMVCGLKVITPDGGRVSYWRAFGRYWAEMLSGIILGIGYIMAAFDDEKRTLHDRICNTRVVRK